MDIFFIGVAVVLVMTLIFYLVFFGFIYYWHAKSENYFIVPMVFAFEVLLRGMVMVAIIALILRFYPDVIRQLNL